MIWRCYGVGKFRTIVADPPWDYSNRAAEGALKYETMTLPDLMLLPVKRIVAGDAYLFLWATTSFLPSAIPLMEAWGFEYKTNMVWVKLGALGLGNYVRVSHEHLLIGIRGKPPKRGARIRSVISKFRVGKHSHKPGVFLKIAEHLGDPPRLELFATQKREGWITLGYEIDGRDIRATLRVLAERLDG